MLRKICFFLSHPLVNIVVGLVFYILVGIWINSLGDGFDKVSALCGVCALISLDILGYGISCIIDKFASKNTPQDLDDDNFDVSE